MNDLYQWAIRHAIPAVALQDLQRMMGVFGAEGQPSAEETNWSEAAVQNNVRLEASHKGMRLWRNNVGGDDRGLRWGLCNETAAVNKVLASSDLIGIEPVLVTPALVGQTIGRFLAVEVKESGWNYTGTGREVPQFNFIKLVRSLGGRAMFANRTGEL